MFQTKITEMFNIQYPIIQGGLQGLGTSALVSSVSNAGALGLITAGSYRNKSEMLEDIQKVRQLTSNPFGVNLSIGIRRSMDEFVEGVIEGEVPTVFTSGSNPEPYMKKFKQHHIKVIHVAPSIKFAKKAESIGCDAVVILGYECGGHPGLEDTTSLVLLEKAIREVSVPVIAAGGFSTGKGLLAALAIGAEGVQMGTRFLLVSENPLHENIKKYLLNMTESDTEIIKKSIKKPARVLKTNVSNHIVSLEEQGATLEEILPFISGESYNELIKTGDLRKGVISLGQTIGLINEILPVKVVVEQIINDAKTHLDKIYRLTNQR